MVPAAGVSRSNGISQPQQPPARPSSSSDARRGAGRWGRQGRRPLVLDGSIAKLQRAKASIALPEAAVRAATAAVTTAPTPAPAPPLSPSSSTASKPEIETNLDDYEDPPYPHHLIPLILTPMTITSDCVQPSPS
ncbi:hypothetical protein Pelo_16264 [Pelomyxa schiedti]|nr:hypothetical protein Pelo_16264 [Pelomyxa schiedti]